MILQVPPTEEVGNALAEFFVHYGSWHGVLGLHIAILLAFVIGYIWSYGAHRPRRRR